MCINSHRSNAFKSKEVELDILTVIMQSPLCSNRERSNQRSDRRRVYRVRFIEKLSYSVSIKVYFFLLFSSLLSVYFIDTRLDTRKTFYTLVE